MIRCLAACALLLVPHAVLTDLSSGRAASKSPPAAESAYALPVRPPVTVLRGFDPPAVPYGPGHLGVDLVLSVGGAVLAAGDGVVRFAGNVAGRGVVVLQHADGLSTEYEPVRPLVARGVIVHRGQLVGRLAGRHRGCPSSCLHWGAERGRVRVDPLVLLRPLGQVRLLPWPRDG